MRHITRCDDEKWLPFALSCLRKMKATGLRYASQKFDVDGSVVRVRTDGDHEYISIEASENELMYEFCATGEEFREIVGGSGYNTHLGYAVKVTVDKDGEPKFTPTGSTVEPPPPPAPGEKPLWKYSESPDDMSFEFMPHRHIMNVGAAIGYTHYPGQSPYARTLHASWGAASQYSEAGILGSGYLSSAVDRGYDTPPTPFLKTSRIPGKGEGGRAPLCDWYRRAGSRKVGDRWFIILTDVSGGILVYPDKIAADGGRAVPVQGQLVRDNVDGAIRLRVPFPEGVRQCPEGVTADSSPLYLADVDLMVRTFPQYIWNFNSTATKCVCVTQYLLPPAGLYSAFTGALAQEVLLGWLELSIDIKVVGPELMDFTAEVSVSNMHDPRVAGTFILATDYAWAVSGQAHDSLITMEYMMYGVNGEDAEAGNPTAPWQAYEAAILVKNFTTNETLYTFPAMSEGVPWRRTVPSAITIRRPADNSWPVSDPHTSPHVGTYVDLTGWLLAYDLRAMAFMVRVCRKTTQIMPYNDGAELPVAYRFERKFSRAEVMRVYMHGVLTYEDYFGGADSAIPQTFTPTLPRIPSNSYSTLGRKFLTLIGYFTDSPRYMDNNALDLSPLDSGLIEYPVGCVLYARSVAACVPNKMFERFSVHPDGHWSVASRNMFYFHSTSSDGLPQAYGLMGVAPRGSKPSASDLRQARVDIINFKIDGADVRTSHIAAFNAAYLKDLQYADFDGISAVDSYRDLGPFNVETSLWRDDIAGTYGRTLIQVPYRRFAIEITATSAPGVTLYINAANQAYTWSDLYSEGDGRTGIPAFTSGVLGTQDWSEFYSWADAVGMSGMPRGYDEPLFVKLNIFGFPEIDPYSGYPGDSAVLRSRTYFNGGALFSGTRKKKTKEPI